MRTYAYAWIWKFSCIKHTLYILTLVVKYNTKIVPKFQDVVRLSLQLSKKIRKWATSLIHVTYSIWRSVQYIMFVRRYCTCNLCQCYIFIAPKFEFQFHSVYEKQQFEGKYNRDQIAITKPKYLAASCDLMTRKFVPWINLKPLRM